MMVSEMIAMTVLGWVVVQVAPILLEGAGL